MSVRIDELCTPMTVPMNEHLTLYIPFPQNLKKAATYGFELNDRGNSCAGIYAHQTRIPMRGSALTHGRSRPREVQSHKTQLGKYGQI